MKKNSYKIKNVLWYGFNHKQVTEKFEGDLTFCNEFCVNGEYNPVAVYKAKTPNVKKGHKKYLLLQTTPSGGLIRGMTPKEMNKHRYQDAALCLNCNTLLYSINRHHYHGCDCLNETHVDGGRDYLKITSKDLTKVKVVKFDLLTNKIICSKK